MAEFFVQDGANYLGFKKDELKGIIKKDFCLLKVNDYYRKLGERKRTSFEWSEPVKYNGLFKDKTSTYILFGLTQITTESKFDYISYAFAVLSEDKYTALQFNNSMKSSRDIDLKYVISKSAIHYNGRLH